MTELILATRSRHKLLEIAEILASVPEITVVDLESAGVPERPEEAHLEPFDTFEENARSKARYFFARTGRPTVADDSGLEVDALDGAPGVRSKRFSPRQDLEGQALDQANLEYLLEVLADVPTAERTARYVCVAALATDAGIRTFRGTAEGLILAHPRGTGGFGYDPVFFDPDLGRTFAEIGRADKNARSHRGKAFRELAAALPDAGPSLDVP